MHENFVHFFGSGQNSSDFEIVLITDDKKIYYSEGIADSVQFTASYEAEVIWRE